MKKIIALAALLSVGAAYAQDDVSLDLEDVVHTSTSHSTDPSTGGEYSGVAFTLGQGADARLACSTANTMSAVQALTTVEIQVRSGHSYSDCKVLLLSDAGTILYQAASVGTISKTVGSTTTNYINISFGENGVEIIKGVIYKLVFARASSTYTVGTSFTDSSIAAQQLAMVGGQNVDVGSGDASVLCTLQKNAFMTHKDTTYIPNITFTSHNVPEPATATLSLLALAGLAARRRRK